MLALSLPSLTLADTFTYSFISGEKKVGHLNAESKGDQTTIDYDVKNNGRGPTIAESITLDAAGLPTAWERQRLHDLWQQDRGAFQPQGRPRRMGGFHR